MALLTEELTKQLRWKFNQEAGMGVTLIDDSITLRLKAPDSEDLIQVTMIVTAVDFGKPTCWSCDEVLTGRVYPAKMTLENCGDDPTKQTVNLCYDCWCPK